MVCKKGEKGRKEEGNRKGKERRRGGEQ